jgi:hypothetical protein
MGFKDWNINDVALSLSAVPLDGGGYAEDEVVSVEWGEDFYTKYKGADGETTRVRTNNFGCVVTLRYAQTADANDRLSAILQADLALPNGGGAGVFSMKDIPGRTIILAERAWVMGPPAVKFAKTVQVYEWKIDLDDARASFFGGR